MRKVATIEILAIIAVFELAVTEKIEAGVILFVLYGLYKVAKIILDDIINS